MRAIYLKDLKNGSDGNLITITGEKAHHLQKVARVKVGEKVLLLDGNGLTIITSVESLGKKELQVKVIESKSVEPSNLIFD